MSEKLSDATSSYIPPIPGEVQKEQVVEAKHFREMIEILDALAVHSHIFYDDYTTVCQCQCQCACNRGIL
jgi:hypothetical protein